MDIKFKKTKEGIVVYNEFWEVTHSKRQGGAWNSIIFKNGSGQNLLAAPITSRIRYGIPNPNAEEQFVFSYEERNEKHPVLKVFRNKENEVVVVAEGRYHDEKGKSIPVKYKRTLIYNEFGLAKSTLDMTAEKSINVVQEICAFSASLRDGMNYFNLKQHPRFWLASMGSTGAWIKPSEEESAVSGCWHKLPEQSYLHRAVPSYLCVIEKNVEGIEMFPESDLSRWDVSGYEEQGLYLVASSGGKTSVEYSPYCYVFRRVPITLKGKITLKMNFGLPFIKERKKVFNKIIELGIDSRWISDKEIKKYADFGVKLFRFHNDYREDGPFWHDREYPPYNKKGMKELKRIINTSHRCGIKIVPYISLKEFHPEVKGYKENHKEWQRMETYSGQVTHTYIGTGEFGGLMCMKSGWLDFSKKAVDIILKDLPWDGLYFDWCGMGPCCNKKHAGGTWHTDADEYIDFVMWCRKRIGKKGFLFLHQSGSESMICENMADLAFVGENDACGRPGTWHILCDFVPIVQRQVVPGLPAEKNKQKIVVMSAMLQGYPVNFRPVTKRKQGAGALRSTAGDFNLYHGEKLDSYKNFLRGTDRPVITGDADVWASVMWKEKKALLYVCNISEREICGSLKLDPKKIGIKTKKLRLQIVTQIGLGKIGKLNSDELGLTGIGYALNPWESCLYKLMY